MTERTVIRSERHVAAGALLLAYWMEDKRTTAVRGLVNLVKQFDEDQAAAVVLNLGRVITYAFTDVDAPAEVLEHYAALREDLIEDGPSADDPDGIIDIEALKVWEAKHHTALMLKIRKPESTKYDWQCTCGGEAPAYYSDIDNPHLYNTFLSHLKEHQ